MKRILAILAATVIMIGLMGSAVADTQTRSSLAEKYENYCEGILESLCELYEKHGDEFDEDYVELTYLYCQLWNAVHEVNRKELQFDLKELVGSSMVFGTNKDLAYGWAKMNMDIEDRWTKYVSREIEKIEFMDFLTKIIMIQINPQNDKK